MRCPHCEKEIKPKYDHERMTRLIEKDGFLLSQFSRLVNLGEEYHAKQVVFNTYVIGDSTMELKYLSC